VLVGDTAEVEIGVELGVEETAVEFEETAVEDVSSPGVYCARRTRKTTFGLTVALPMATELFWKQDSSLVS